MPHLALPCRPAVVLTTLTATIVMLTGCTSSSHSSAASSSSAATSSASTTSAGTSSSSATPTTSGSAATTSVAASGTAAAGSGSIATDAADGVSIALPAGYRQIKDAAQLQQLLDKGASTSTFAKGLMTKYGALLKSSIKIFALDTDQALLSDNVNLLVTPAQGASISELKAQLPQLELQLRSAGAKVGSTTTTTVAGSPALRLAYTLSNAGQELKGSQAYVLHHDKLYIITVTQAPTSSPAAAEAIFAGVSFS